LPEFAAASSSSSSGGGSGGDAVKLLFRIRNTMTSAQPRFEFIDAPLRAIYVRCGADLLRFMVPDDDAVPQHYPPSIHAIKHLHCRVFLPHLLVLSQHGTSLASAFEKLLRVRVVLSNFCFFSPRSNPLPIASNVTTQ